MSKSFLSIGFWALLLYSCASSNDESFVRNTEARDDSVKLASALKGQSSIKNIIYADVETEKMPDSAHWDTADDPAIWYNAANPAKSLIIGTNKKRGIFTYDIQGKLVQKIENSLPNNVDVRDAVLMQDGSRKAVFGYSNKKGSTIDLMFLDTAALQLTERPVCQIKTDIKKVYGFCMYYNKEREKLFAIVNGKSGAIQQWQINFGLSGKIEYKLIKKLSVPTQPEGMVVDDATGKLFIGEEEKGIHIFNLLDSADTKSTFIKESTEDYPFISYDIEGLTIIDKSDSAKYLLASIQGNFTYALYDIKNNNSYMGSFKIGDGKVDGVSETDGIDVCTKPFPDFPDGILVVQDGFNKDGGESVSQNFKILSLTSVYKVINKTNPVLLR